MQAVIVSFDSLPTSSLGCYGNEWVETPHWDRLAASGITFDLHFADSVGPSAGMAWANGQHALVPDDSAATRPLGSWLKEANVATRLIVAGELDRWHRCAGFDSTETVSGYQSTDVLPDQVPFANLVKAGLSSWNDKGIREGNRLLWLHSAGPGIPPAGFDALYFEDFEERGLQVDCLSETEIANHPSVYAGAVSLIDHWLGELLGGIMTVPSAEPLLVIVMASRGRDWEHLKALRSHFGQAANPLLCDQRIRSPLVINVTGTERFKDYFSYRSNHLVQTCDLVPTLLEWFEIDQTAQAGYSWLNELANDVSSRSSLWIGDEIQFDAIRTSNWLCIRDGEDRRSIEAASTEQLGAIALFEKPDDLWDVNNVALQQPDVVGELLKLFPCNEPRVLKT